MFFILCGFLPYSSYSYYYTHRQLFLNKKGVKQYKAGVNGNYDKKSPQRPLPLRTHYLKSNVILLFKSSLYCLSNVLS